IEAERHTTSRGGDPTISFGGDTPYQIPVEIRGKEIAEDNMGEGRREMIGSLDAGSRMRRELVGQIRRSSLRNCLHQGHLRPLLCPTPSILVFRPKQGTKQISCREMKGMNRNQ